MAYVLFQSAWGTTEKNTSRNIRQAQDSGVVVAFKLLVTENDCDVCQARREMVIPANACLPEMLPPYEDCKLEDGCRASFTCVLSRKYENLLAAYPPGSTIEESPDRPGCLGVLLAIVSILTRSGSQ